MKINEVLLEKRKRGGNRNQQKAIANVKQQQQAQPASNAGANAFGQMAQQATQQTQPAGPTQTSTGGMVQQTPTGQIHTANPTNPNVQQQQVQVPEPAQQQQVAAQPEPMEKPEDDPYDHSPVDLKGYQVNKQGRLVRAPSGWQKVKDIAKGFVQGATGGKVDPRAPALQGAGKPGAYKAPDYTSQEMAKVAATKRQQAAQPQATAQPAQPQQVDPAQALAKVGATVVSQEPIIIKYQNKEFGLNDNGEWMHMASGRVQQQSAQAFLDQLHKTSLGL